MSWYVWTALLAALSFGVPGYGPMTLGLGDTTAFAVAMLLYVSLQISGLLFEVGRIPASSRVRHILTWVGWATTAMLVIAEALPLVGGTPLPPVEFISSVVSVLCWALVSSRWEATADTPPTWRVIIALLVGVVWPAVCVSTSGFVPDRFAALSRCLGIFIVSFCTAYFSRCRGGLTVQEMSSLLLGHFIFLGVWGPFHWITTSPLPNVLQAFAPIVLVLLSVLLLWFGFRKIQRGPLREQSREGQDGLAENYDPALSASLSVQEAESAIEKAFPANLTERERLVLARTALGATAKSISKDLGLAEATIATYRRRGYEKLGVSGAKELRGLAAGFGREGESLPSEVYDGVRNAQTSEKERDPQPIALGLGSVFLLMAPVLDLGLGKLLVGLFPFVKPGFIAWPISLGLAVIGAVELVRTSPSRSLPSEHGTSRMELIKRVGTAVLVCTLSVGACCAWQGMTTFRFWVPILLISSALAMGLKREAGVSDRGFAPHLLHTLMLGVENLFFHRPFALLLAAVVIGVMHGLNPQLFDLVAYVAHILYSSLETLAILMLVLRAGTATVPVEVPTGSESQRALLYLRGRGMGELRAHIMLDLACGYDVLEVCRRNYTTIATVRSYRHRSYRDLDIHSIAELRELLRRDAKFTGRDGLHSDK